MLSKSKGQVLRVAAILHVLFYLGKDGEDEDDLHEDKGEKDGVDAIYRDAGNIDSEISEKALKAAINFVSLCCQQTAFIAG